MKEKELAKFVDWLVQSGESPEGASFDETVSWINELATSEEGQQILGRLIQTYKNKEMGIFKEGGKLNYLLCLKSGGNIQDCGCGKKIRKKQEGGDVESKHPLNRDASDSVNDFYDQWTDKNGNVRTEVSAYTNGGVDNPDISYIKISSPEGDVYDYGGWSSPQIFRNINQRRLKKAYDKSYNQVVLRAKSPEVIQQYKPVGNGEPMLQAGGEISRRSALDVLRATGSKNAESRKEYRQLKRDARAEGLRGKEMRQAARNAAITRGIDRILPALGDVKIEEIPISLEDTFANIEVPTSLGISIMDKVPVTPNDVIGGSFKEAFAEARKRNLKDFVWDNANAKYSRYSTALAKPDRLAIHTAPSADDTFVEKYVPANHNPGGMPAAAYDVLYTLGTKLRKK